MRLREDLRPLVRTDSVCAVQTDGIVGSAFIQIGRGTDGAPPVQAGDTLAGSDPVEFADLIQEGRRTFQAVTTEVGELGDGLSDVLDGLEGVTQSADTMIDGLSQDLRVISSTSASLVEDGRQLVSDVRTLAADVRSGRGSIGRLLTDDALYDRLVRISSEAEGTVSGLRATTEHARDLVQRLGSPDSTAQQIVQSLRDTLNDTREVMSDLSEGTEALKRNFLFRGFFTDRGFFDLDTMTRDAYLEGALEGKRRTALRVWVDAAGLFAPGTGDIEQLTEPGRRRLDSAMADFVRYPRDSPLVVEGYADGADENAAFVISADRAELVRDYLLRRFRRQVTLTGVMPMATDAPGSPRGDGHWSGVALTLFVQNEDLAPARPNAP